MSSSPFLFIKNFGYVQLVADLKGKTFLNFTLTEKQQSFLGLEISPFVCFRKYDLCEQHLKRIHLTCFRCFLRRVVSGKLPLFFEIHVHQVWEIEADSNFRKFLFKNLLSLAEVSS